MGRIGDNPAYIRDESPEIQGRLMTAHSTAVSAGGRMRTSPPGPLTSVNVPAADIPGRWC
jgi:hypothetical protein